MKFNRRLLLVSLGGVFSRLGIWAQAPPSETYGPWNRDLEWHESADGLAFQKKGIFVARGGVPAVIRLQDGRLYAAYQWFPLDRPRSFDQIAVKFSSDEGKSWTVPETIHISDMPSGLYRSFDPTPVSLPDGRIRLYFTSERISPTRPRGNRAIFSAVSSDGLGFLFEPGQRFGFDSGETFDSALAFHSGRWHLYCPVPGTQGRGYHATSDDGLSFLRQQDVLLPVYGDWLGNVVPVSSGLNFYGSGWAGFSPDGFIWNLRTNQTGLGGDPAVVVINPGGFFAVSTGPLRPDARKGSPALLSRRRRS